MGNLHQVVINYISQMVSRITIGLEENEIIQGGIFKCYLTTQQIIEWSLTFERRLKTNHWDNPLRLHLCPLFPCKITTMAVIAGWLFSLHLFLTHGLQSLCRTIALIS